MNKESIQSIKKDLDDILNLIGDVDHTYQSQMEVKKTIGDIAQRKEKTT